MRIVSGIISEELGKRGLRLIDLAQRLSVNKATTTRWDQNGVPFERLEEVEQATGILPREQRPDLAALMDRRRIESPATEPAE